MPKGSDRSGDAYHHRDMDALVDSFGDLRIALYALAAPETPKALSRQAHELFKSRRDLVRDADCSTVYRPAVRLGDWAFSWADVATRLLARWWPIAAL